MSIKTAPVAISDPLLTKKDVAELIGVEVRTLERWIAIGNFPRPMKVAGSSHCLRWRRSIVDRYLEKLARESEKAG